MPRPVLDADHIHPAVRDRVAGAHAETLREVRDAVAKHDVVVVGMAQNLYPKKALASLRAAGIEPRYLSYGSYLSGWKQRLAIKMWSGWPTFPMVFVRGSLVGGASDVKALIESGELKQMLDAPKKKG